MIDEFIEVLDVGAAIGLIAFDADVIRAAHRDAEAFDVEALAADSARLGATARRLTGAVSPTGIAFGEFWSGSGGLAAGIVSVSATGGVDAVIREVDETAEALDAATTVAAEVLGRYGRAMETVCDPTVCGVHIDALAAAVGNGTVAADDARTEFIARIEYADAVGHTVGDALAAVVHDATGTGASTGELVLAGGR